VNADELAQRVFRIPMEEAIRMQKRNSKFRHVLFAAAELDDPIDPAGGPFTKHDLLSVIEKDWDFRRDAVPDHINLFVGRAARERLIQGIREDYNRMPADRYRQADEAARCVLENPDDPDSWWDDPFACALLVPVELTGLDIGICWFGSRAEALTRYRKWFFDPRCNVFHGTEAVKMAREPREILAGWVQAISQKERPQK
jgi:hypothetical protein